MDLINLSPFAAAHFVSLCGDGYEQLLVVVKATYRFDQGRLALLEDQPAILVADEYRGEPGLSSLAAAADTAPKKPATDILVSGCAYTRRGTRTETLVSLVVGAQRKVLRVVGDRSWTKTPQNPKMQPSAPKPFDKLPVIYERAYGGIDTSNPAAVEVSPHNPVGVGFRGKKVRPPVEGAPLPNIEDPRAPVQTPDDLQHALGLGPIAPAWSPRRELGGTYDERWQISRMPLLPRDFDSRFHQVAPLDQQREGTLQGGESVCISGMTQEGELQLTLPRARPEVIARFRTARIELPCVCDTATIDCEQSRLALTWRALYNVQGRLVDLHWVRIKAAAS